MFKRTAPSAVGCVRVHPAIPISTFLEWLERRPDRINFVNIAATRFYRSHTLLVCKDEKMGIVYMKYRFDYRQTEKGNDDSRA